MPKHRRAQSRSGGVDDEHRKRSKVDDRKSKSSESVVRLPFNRKTLAKHDLADYKALFALYLDVQKEIRIEDLDDHELKGRWKSFMKKWNSNSLSEGYYDPAMRTKASAMQSRAADTHHVKPAKPIHNGQDDDDEGDTFGPALPRRASKGAAVPGTQDLLERDELNEAARGDDRQMQRSARRAEKKLQEGRLDELVPRAEAGTRERQLEKKREKAEANRSFREARSPGADEVGEGDLMGEDGIEGYRAKAKENERRKTEREIRKEEALRARTAERETRLAAHRAKEDQTMEKLKALARERFG